MNSLTSRRRFLQAGLAIALVGSNSTAFAASGKLRIRKSLKHGMIKVAKSIAEKFALAKQAGFDGIEFDGPIKSGDLPQIKDASAETDLPVPGLVAGAAGRMMALDDESERKRGIERFSQALHDAKALGGNTVLLYPGIVNEKHQYDVVYERLQKAIAQLIPISRETGVKIACENVWNNIFVSPLEARDFVDSFNSSQVGWYFDVGNVVRFGWPEHWIRILPPSHLQVGHQGIQSEAPEQRRPLEGLLRQARRRQRRLDGSHEGLARNQLPWWLGISRGRGRRLGTAERHFAPHGSCVCEVT